MSATGEGAGLRPWYEESFRADYLARYAHRSQAEAHTAVGTLAPYVPFDGADVLDLACGAGRHIPALLDHGARRVVGLDLSADLLAAARAALAEPVAQGRVRLVRGDMREIPLPDAAVDVVVSFFTSFGYFEAEGDDERVLGEVARVLRPGGRYVLDFFNASVTIAELVCEEEQRAADGTLHAVRRWYDSAARRLEKRVADVAGVETRRESVRAYRPAELVELAGRAGLAFERAFGHYDDAPFDEATSRRYLAVFRRGNAADSRI